MQTQLPTFSTIKISQIDTELTSLLEKSQQEINSLSEPNLIGKLEDILEKISIYWNPIECLNNCKASASLSKVYAQCLEKLTQFFTKLHHDHDLYEKIKRAQSNNPEHKKARDYYLRDFKLNGVTLDQANKKAFSNLSNELAQLSHQFSENVRLSTEDFYYTTEDKTELNGVPQSTVNSCKAVAKQKNKEGFCITLDFPIYSSIMQTATNRKLRERLYHAYVTRASELSTNKAYDNSKLLLSILKKREEQANLLDFKHHAEYSLFKKMADNPKSVMSFLESLVKNVKPIAEKELKALQKFAKQNGLDKLEPWDIPFYSEQLKKENFDIDNELISQYFPAKQVIPGVLEIASQLFSIQFKANTSADVWDPKVQLFEIYKQNKCIAYLYLDLYARQGKRGGAWMAECQNRHRMQDGHLNLPIAFLNCNFQAPTKTQESLLKHDDVVTLFHELGHCLHHLLTQNETASIAGINNVPWDAVELPSQFLENWAWSFEVIKKLSCHTKTQKTMPKALFDKLYASKNFQSALFLLRQLEFALFDFNLHQTPTPKSNQDVRNLLKKLRSQVAVVPNVESNRFENSFSHIFAGGYAAGYYSYLWAEVLAADVFSLFKKAGLFDPALSEHYQVTILSKGSLEDMQSMIEAFLQRPVRPEALLESYGLNQLC